MSPPTNAPYATADLPSNGPPGSFTVTLAESLLLICASRTVRVPASGSAPRLLRLQRGDAILLCLLALGSALLRHLVAPRGAALLEAVAAVHGLVPAGLEREACLAPAVAAGRGEHLAGSAVAAAAAAAAPAAVAAAAATARATRCAVLGAPRGCVLEPARGVELLLARRPDEFPPTVATGQRLVLEAHFTPRSHATLNLFAPGGTGSFQAGGREEPDRVAGRSGDSEVREDLADDARELEAVTRARRREDDVRVVRERVDHEVRVRAHRVKADLRLASGAVAERQALAHPLADTSLVGVVDLPVDGVRVDARAVMERGDLEAVGGVVREAVEEPRRLLDDVDRQPRERVALGARLEPEEDDALDPEMRRDEGHEPSEPRARGDHQPARVVASGGRPHADAVRGGLPPLDRLGEAQRRAVPLGLPEMRLDRALRCEPPGLFFMEAHPAVGPLEQWKARAERRDVEDLVWESLRARARERPAHELAAWRARVEAAGLRQEGLAAGALELAPEVPRAAEQPNVVGVLEVREPDDPRKPAGR